MENSIFEEDWVQIPVPAVGLYMLIWKEAVVYVGQSVDLLGRILVHHRRLTRWRKGYAARFGEPRVIQFDRVLVSYCKEEELDALEFKLIREYRPKYNAMHNRHDSYGLENLDLEGLGVKEEDTKPKRQAYKKATPIEREAKRQAREMQRLEKVLVTLPNLNYVPKEQCTASSTQISKIPSPNYLRR